MGASDTFVKVSLTGFTEIIFALSQQANGSLADIINSLLQHTNNNLHKILCLITQKGQETNKIGNIGAKKNSNRIYSDPKDYPLTILEGGGRPYSRIVKE